jgi:PKD domain
LLNHCRVAIRILILAAAASAALAVGSAEARAAPEYPIPADKPAPPPLPALPPAGETPPPADAIGDPITPDATCGDWHLQGDYGGRWPAGSTWWEYDCTLALVVYPSCSGTGQCDQGYWEIGSSTDRFYWDGSGAVFYGQNSQFGCEHWWDEPTGQWYILESPGCVASTSNAPPTATFTSECSGLSCSLDAGGSADGDGTIESYGWEFGDGTTGGGKTAQHTFAQPGTYTVVLTVTDNGGATATDAKPVTLIGLTARGYKVKGLQKVDLSWSGAGAGSFDVYRNDVKIATVPGTEYTDNLDRRGSGSYRYKVCEAGTSTCSDQATVTF